MNEGADRQKQTHDVFYISDKRLVGINLLAFCRLLEAESLFISERLFTIWGAVYSLFYWALGSITFANQNLTLIDKYAAAHPFPKQ